MNSVLSALFAMLPGMTGALVGNLQTILARRQLAQDPPEETVGQRLGPGTMRAVRQLFATAGLGDNPTGAIETRAASKLNKFLVELRILALAFGNVLDEARRRTTGFTAKIHDALNLDGAATAEKTVNAEPSSFAFHDPQFNRYGQASHSLQNDAFTGERAT